MLKRRMTNKEEGRFSKEVLELAFRHPIGIRSGYDKYAKKYNGLWSRHFSFVEIGPFNYLDYSAKTAIEKIVKKAAIPHLFCEIEHLPTSVDEETIIDDYVSVFSLMYDFVDLITINASQRNQGGSCPLQDITLLSSVLDRLMDMRIYYDNYKPIVVKVSPDIHESQLNDIIHYCRLNGIDGICIGIGPDAKDTIQKVYKATDGRFPIIGSSVSGDPSEIKNMIDSGASLVGTTLSIRHHGLIYLRKILKSL